MSRLHSLHEQGHSLSIDEAIPSAEPIGRKLVKHFDYYTAEFSFRVTDKRFMALYSSQEPLTLSLRIPLGIVYDPNKEEIAGEAQARLRIVEKHLADMQQQGKWETVAEATHYLKSEVVNKRPYGWRTSPSKPVEHYGNDDVNLGFPASSQQTTTLKSTTINFENRSGNPTWRLRMAIKVTGLEAGWHGNLYRAVDTQFAGIRKSSAADTAIYDRCAGRR